VKGSRPKKDQRFDALSGPGVSGSAEQMLDVGEGSRVIELRRWGDCGLSNIAGLNGRSRIAPAVLGRVSVGWREKVEEATEAASRSTMVDPVRDMMEEMLPESEWPGRAVTVLDVSLETKDRGRGINSRVSENPTLARFGSFAGILRP